MTNGLESVLREINLTKSNLARQELQLIGEIQKMLQNVADTTRKLREQGVSVDFRKPEFDQALRELGLLADNSHIITKRHNYLNREESKKMRQVIEELLSSNPPIDVDFIFRHLPPQNRWKTPKGLRNELYRNPKIIRTSRGLFTITVPKHENKT